MNDKLTIAGKKFTSRLFIGTGKFGNLQVMQTALRASETQIVTVALRRVDFRRQEKGIYDYLEDDRYIVMPNTSGARNAEEAVKMAQLARAAGLSRWVKLEVTPEPRYLLPDGDETLKAAQILVKEGFVVLPYIQADPILAKKLEDCGTATVMPLAAPIGTNKGVKNQDMLQIIIEQSTVPVVIDAGLGAPSHAALSMEMGADAVLVNTAVATAGDPITIARSFKMAVEAGRMGYLASLGQIRDEAEASSPLTGFLRSL